MQLQQYRKRAELSQTALAARSTVSVRAVRNLELGKVAAPRRETVRLLADGLRLSARERVAFEQSAGAGTDDEPIQALALLPGATVRPLFGRERELAALLRNLRSEHQRISSICGLAGVGKTELALAAGARIQSADATSVLLLRVPAERSGGPVYAGSDWPPATEDDGLDWLARNISDQRTLLIVDGNDSAGVSREAMWSLLRDRPKLHILETRRSADPGECYYRLFLGPLPITQSIDMDRAVGDGPAVDLLVEFIAELRPDFAPDREELAKCAEICRHLDGLPGALEAAASWATVVSLDEVLAMARTEPQILATHPSGSFDPEAMTREALSSQQRHHGDLLVKLLGPLDAWTMKDVVDRLGISRLRAASGLQALVRSGLLVERAAPAGGEVRFSVLRLVRAYLGNHPAHRLALQRQVPGAGMQAGEGMQAGPGNRAGQVSLHAWSSTGS